MAYRKSTRHTTLNLIWLKPLGLLLQLWTDNNGLWHLHANIGWMDFTVNFLSLIQCPNHTRGIVQAPNCPQILSLTRTNSWKRNKFWRLPSLDLQRTTEERTDYYWRETPTELQSRKREQRAREKARALAFTMQIRRDFLRTQRMHLKGVGSVINSKLLKWGQLQRELIIPQPVFQPGDFKCGTLQ